MKMPLSRRQLHVLLLATGGRAACGTARAQGPKPRLVLVHGRAQGGRDPAVIKREWLQALAEGAARAGRRLPVDLEVELPFYATLLDEYAAMLDLPLADDIRTRGPGIDSELLEFQAAVAESIRIGAGITDAQIDAEYGANPKPKAWYNAEWVLAIFRAIDRHFGGLTQVALETFTRDVFLYATRSGVQRTIDAIVAGKLATDRPNIVVGHSLGSVVAFNVLLTERRMIDVPLFVTVGSPLGIRPINDEFRPLERPAGVGFWLNAYDPRDVVSLYPLDDAHFPVRPAIENLARIDNQTDNRHGIAGYLDDPTLAGRILDAIGP